MGSNVPEHQGGIIVGEQTRIKTTEDGKKRKRCRWVKEQAGSVKELESDYRIAGHRLQAVSVHEGTNRVLKFIYAGWQDLSNTSPH